MIEYYIKNSKNIRKDILALIKELKNYFLIWNVMFGTVDKTMTGAYFNLNLSLIKFGLVT